MTRPFKTTLLDRHLRRQQQENERQRQEILQRLLQLLPKLAPRYGFDQAYVFGSLAKKGRFRKTSDIDLAVRGLTNEKYFAFMAELSNRLGREVDVIQVEKHHLSKRIMETGIIMEQERLSVLEADIRNQLNQIDGIYEKIAERKKGYLKDPAVMESLAYQLHNLYCAFEDLFRIVADYFENHLVEPTIWHKELLTRMKLPIRDVRPSVISESAFALLDELRGFRHVFRHAYGFELEAAKVKIVLQKALALKKIYKKDMANFLGQLKAAMKA